MKQHHFNLSKLSELMTYSEYEQLNAMHLQRQSTPYPSELSKSLGNSHGANLLTRLIIKHAKYSGFEFIRTGNTGIPIVNRATGKVEGWRQSQAKAGSIFDISGAIHGERVEIEVKFGKDRLSPGQREHLENVNNRGGLAFVVRSYSQYLAEVAVYFDKEYFKAWKIQILNDL